MADLKRSFRIRHGRAMPLLYNLRSPENSSFNGKPKATVFFRRGSHPTTAFGLPLTNAASLCSAATKMRARKQQSAK